MNPDQPNQQPTQEVPPIQSSAEPAPDPRQGPKESDIAPKAAARRGRLFDPTGKIEGLMADETLVADVRRHWFGLYVLYLQILTGLGLSLLLSLAFMPTLSEALGVSTATLSSIGAIFALFVIVFGIIFLILATRIYKANQLIVSDKNVTQVLQIGLFDRKVSELSMANVEDVTAQQKGIFPTLFNYGTLRIETAGEQNNFVFVYCPNPNAYAKAILDSRLEFITENGE